MPLEVHVVTPEREVWSGPAEMLIARGVEGEVGILTGHAPLLIQLAIGPLRILRASAEEVAAVVDGGFLHVGTHEGATRADVLANRAEVKDEIDVEVARRLVAELEQRGTPSDEAERAAWKTELQRARARLNLAG